MAGRFLIPFDLFGTTVNLGEDFLAEDFHLPIPLPLNLKVLPAKSFSRVILPGFIK